MEILITTDFSLTSQRAIDFALQMFDRDDNSFHLMHAVAMPYSSLMISDPLTEDLVRHEQKKLWSIEKELLDRYPDLKIRSSVERGLFPRCVEKYVSEQLIDFVVIGSNGTSGVFEKIIGSNTLELINSLNIPTLVVPVHVQFESAIKAVISVKNIDDSDRKTLAKYLNALNTDVKALDFYNIYSKEDKQEIDTSFIPKQFDNRVQKIYHENDRKVSIEDQISTFVTNNNYNLVGVLPENLNFFKRLIHRSVSNALIDECSFPVLIIR